MINIRAYEFKDLSDDTKKEVFDKWLNEDIEFELSCLENDLQAERITEKEFYNQLGCDKNYAESTGWFVPSCYYDKHKDRLERVARTELKKAVFTSTGSFIQIIE